MIGNSMEPLNTKTTDAKPATTLTVRELISRLVNVEDMDATVQASFSNSDGMDVTDVTDAGDGTVVLVA